MMDTTTEEQSVTSRMSKRLLSFRGNKKNADASCGHGVSPAEEAPPTTNKKNKSKSMRRLRGLLKGKITSSNPLSRQARKESRAKRKAAREAARARGVEMAPSVVSDMESIYGVSFDSAPNTPTRSLLGGHMLDDEEYHTDDFISPEKTNEPLQIVLLLLDPDSRRFELLQLEFDSHSAIVSDVIAQIDVSSTEETFRRVKYTGLSDRSGLELIKSLRLSDFVSGKDVLIAIPEGMTAKECARLGKPVLANERVTKMLRSSGIGSFAFRLPETPANGKTTSSDSISSVGVTWLSLAILLVAIGVLVQAFHLHLSAPLGPGHVLKPGASKNKCGILSFLQSCEGPSLEMGENGVLTMYGPDQSVEWKIVGAVCSAGNRSCTDGLVVKDNGSLEIGGQAVTSVTVLGRAPLAPWPLAENPRLRVIRG